MIKFILGRSATGKTTRLFAQAEQAIARGEAVCLIVPEQESMLTERECQAKYDDAVEVLSFHRMCDTLMRRYGGAAAARLGEVARMGMLYRAVETVRPNLKYYYKSASDAHFFEKLMPVMDNFAAYKADGEQILAALDSEDARAKYRDLFLIYDCFAAAKRGQYRDNFDELETAISILDGHSYFEGKTVLIDQFGGFTEQEYAILERIFLQARDVSISLLADADDKLLFAPTLSHLNRLQALCDSMGLRHTAETVTHNYRLQAVGLRVLEKYLFSSKRPDKPQPDDGSVRILSTSSPEAEVRAVASDIRRRVLTGECRYRDISVVSNIQDDYARTVETVFSELEIPFYTDRRVEVLGRPLFSMILHAIDAVQYGYRFEDMFALAKTYLCGLDFEQVAKLENYAYIWRIRGAKWDSEWTQSPYGLDKAVKEEDIEQERALLAEINALRRKFITPLVEFKEDTAAGKATDLLAAIWRLTQNFGVKEQIKSFVLSAATPQIAEQWKRLYELLPEFLDQMALILQDQQITREKLRDMMEVCLRCYDFGVPPATIDQVHFGDMIRARSGQVKHLYVLGAVRDGLPSVVSGSNMITDADIRRLREHHIRLAKDASDVTGEQQICIYRTLSSATDTVTFSYPAFAFDGEANLPSPLVTRISDKLIDLRPLQPSPQPTHISELCRYYMTESDAEIRRQLHKTITAAGGPDVSKFKCKPREDETLSRETVEMLYHKDLSASQTRVESFADCPFKFYMQYGLKLKALKPAEFAASYIGTFVHAGMEQMMREIQNSGSLSEWDYERVDTFLNDFAERHYRDELSDLKSPRFDHLFRRIVRSMTLFGHSALDELRHSRFFPEAQEYKFCKYLPIADGFRMKFNGFIDRIDAAELNGTRWLKIMDYKTGGKEFEYDKIYNGFQLQLPLYAKMLTEEPKYRDSKIALMEYVNSVVPKFDTLGAHTDDGTCAKIFNRHGVSLDDVDLIEALDDTPKQKRYLHTSVNADGSLSKNSAVISPAQMEALCAYATDKVGDIMRRVAAGETAVNPMKGDKHNACEFCDFAAVCRFENGDSCRRYRKIGKDEFFDTIMKGEN